MKRGSVCALGVGLLAGCVGTFAQGTPSQWDGLYTVEQAKRGAALYELKCSVCHGSDLTGGQMAPALVGKDFAGGWNNLPLSDLFDVIQVSMPQNDPGTLTNAQGADLLSYVFERGNYPAGQSELPGDKAQLSKYRFAAVKPGS